MAITPYYKDGREVGHRVALDDAVNLHDLNLAIIRELRIGNVDIIEGPQAEPPVYGNQAKPTGNYDLAACRKTPDGRHMLEIYYIIRITPPNSPEEVMDFILINHGLDVSHETLDKVLRQLYRELKV